MNEFDKYFNDEFFIIDSNNLNTTKTKLYGYFIDFKNNKVVTQDNISNKDELTPNGTYIYVKRNENNLVLYQDYLGSYGIYQYKNEDYFCLSNSFLKLIEYLRDKGLPFSLNEDYSNAFMTSHVQSFIIRQTLINEIEILPRNYIVNVDLNEKNITYTKINYKENSIEINSPKALETLDKWYFKWVCFLRNLKKNTNNIWMDLSGGFDSRGLFTLIIPNNFNLDEMFIHSITNGGYTLNEDYEIAKKIANYYDFKLNNKEVLNTEKYFFNQIETPIKLSFYTKLGFHNQLHYKLHKNKEPLYLIGGAGGELNRNIPAGTVEDYLNLSENFPIKFRKSIERILKYNNNQIGPFDNIESGIYREARSRYHFGRANIEDYLTNAYGLHPYIDCDFCKIKNNDENCQDKQLLFALLFVRYCPDLLNFEFQGNRKFDEKTLEYAKQINEKYPFKQRNYDLAALNKQIKQKNDLKDDHNTNTINSTNSISLESIIKLMKDIFYSKTFKNNFEIYYPHELYSRFSKNIENSNYYPDQQIYPSLTILKIINDIKISNYNSKKEDITDWLNHFLNPKMYSEKMDDSIFDELIKYNTARIDLINYGQETSLEIMELSDKDSNVFESSWIDSKLGSGFSIENYHNQLKIKVKCIGNGRLDISLRGVFQLDKQRKIFPIYIDYTDFYINNQQILDDNVLVWHDKSYIRSKKVKDGEILTFSIKWKPFTNNSIF